MAAAEQMSFPTNGTSANATDNGASATADNVTEYGGPAKKKRASSKAAGKKTGKKAAKKTGKKAGKKAAKKAGKKTAKKVAKKTTKRKASKKSSSTALARRPNGCEAVLRVTPTQEIAQLANWSELTRNERRKALIMVGATAVVTTGIVYLLLRSKAAKAASPVANADTGEGTVEIEDAPIDVEVEPNGTALPPPIKLGNIPPLYTRIYQLFDRFVEGGMEFFANLGDSEGKHNIYAVNPAGVPLSLASIERQMKSGDYGKKWSGSGTVPYTAYAQPEKAKALGAIGLFQGIAGTIGQAGRRNGTALLAPLPVDQWIDPANQLAAFMELFGALYHEFNAKTPVAMRIAWGFPSKANKTTDSYYIDRSAKWAERQKTTGVTAASFGGVTVRDHSVAEVAAYFRQFDYSPILQDAAKKPRMSQVVAPLKPIVLQRLALQMKHPAFIGNDLT